MTWTYHSIDAFSDYAPTWDAINKAGPDWPILDSAFFNIFLQKMGSGKEILACYKNPAEAGISAMGLFTETGKWGISTYQPAQAPLGAWICAPDANTEKLTRALLECFPGRRMIAAITQQDPNFIARPTDSGILLTLDYLTTPAILVDGSYEEFLDSLSKQFRKNTRRWENKLAQRGITRRLEILSEPGDMAKAVDDFALLESSGWKGAAGTAVHPDSPQGELYRQIFSHFAGKGEAFVHRYLYDDRLVASDLCLRRNKILYIMKTTFDEAEKDTSPTQLMRLELLAEYFEKHDVARIESYGREKSWHKNTAQSRRAVYHVNVYRWPLIKAVHTLKRKARIESQNRAELTD